MSYVTTPLRLEEHREALGRLWAENMSDGAIAAAIPARMLWLYEQGPDGPPATVLCSAGETGEVVGCGSFLPRPTWVDGKRLAGAVLCDFAVARAHRVVGAALGIQRALIERARAAGVELLYAYPNQKSAGIFRRLGYRLVGETTTWVKPIHSAYKLRSRLRWPWAVTLGAGLVDLGLRAGDGLRRLRLRVPAQVRPLAGGEAELDALWARSRHRYGVVGERSAAWLGWRYGGFSTAAHHSLAIHRAGGDAMTGFAVYAVREGKALVQELFAEDLEETLDALLLALAAQVRRQGLDAIWLGYLGPPALAARLRRLGFVLRPDRRPLMVYAESLPEAQRARVLDPDGWFMFDGELDI